MKKAIFMFCKRAVLVNWGNIPHLEFDFGPINLFSGGNGSGKTTAADALQSLMTAAHENLFTYNPGQDETTQRGRGGKNVRTLASYVLGCDDGSYARIRPTDGYVAAVFHPTRGESGDKFTAIMGVRARLDSASASRQARQDQLVFIIIPDTEVSLSDFVIQDSKRKYVVPITELAKRLQVKVGKQPVEVYDKKGPYLRRLYGAFRGLTTSVPDREAKHAARTFSNFMAYKPVKSITEFVSREVLEPKDLTEDIQQVSELMKTIHGMDEETGHIRSAIENLELAKRLANNYVDNWLQHCLGKYSESSRQLNVAQENYVQKKREQNSNLGAIAKTKDTIRDNGIKKQSLHEQLVNLTAQRQGISALKDKDQLEQDIESCEKKLVEQARPLLEQDHQFSKNHQAAVALKKKLTENSMTVVIPTLNTDEFRKALKNVVEADEDTGLNAQALLTKDWVGIGELEKKLTNVHELEAKHSRLWQVIYSHNPKGTHNNNHNDKDYMLTEQSSLRDHVLSVVRSYQEQLRLSKQKLTELSQTIQRYKHHNVNYPPHIAAAVDAIESQCPKAKPAVLCDFIEIADPQWQMSIEGYIGGARFSIIVEPEYEADAIRIVRSLHGHKNKARIIQGEKSQRDATKISLPKDSIFNVMVFDHKIVEYYIKASYGAVVRVADENTLRKTARGITVAGLGSGNYSMFRCDLDDSQLVFGQGARERAVNALQAQYDELERQSEQHNEAYQDAARIYDLMNQIEAIHCGDLIRSMLDLYRTRESAELTLRDLDLSDFDALETQLSHLNNEFKVLDSDASALSRKLGELTNKSKIIDSSIDKVVKEQEQLQLVQDEREQEVLKIATVYADFDTEARLAEADDRAGLGKNDIDFDEENREYLSQMDKLERQLYEAIIQHNQMTQEHNAIVYHSGFGEKNDADFFASIVKIRGQILSVYNSLKNNILVGKHEKLTALKESFNTAFVTNLCHSIYQSIDNGKRTLDELNKELEHHRFGADQERFYFDYDWVPEYREYWRFFTDIIAIPSLGDGTTLFDANLSEKSCVVRDKLLSMLLDKDAQTALRELNRISDYRNYRRYEIYKEPLNKEPIALSTYGTGSGGQLETPAYIIRSAAVTSAFKFNDGSSHCRMVLVDEAFSKMDENRSREVINYLTETLGLQLIFIMPTSKSGPFMDLISNQVVFSKCPTAEPVGELKTQVLVDRKICNQEKIKALWAKHRKVIRQQAMLDFMEGI